MIIHNLDLIGIPVSPDKAHTPLIVDPDAVLAFAIAFQGFETIGEPYSQVIQASGVVEHT